MDINKVQNSQLKFELQLISNFSEQYLSRIGVLPKARDIFLRDIVVPMEDSREALNACWQWSGSVSSHAKPRPLISVDGKQYYAYRISYALFNGVELTTKDVICHHCPGGENCMCSTFRHLERGDAALNAQHRQEYGTVASGDRNGSRTKPECMKRGIDHWRFPIRDRERAFRTVQAIKATLAEYDVSGLNRALSKYFPPLTEAIIESIRNNRADYASIPVCPSMAIPLESLEIKGKGCNKGFAHPRVKMPEIAVLYFCFLYFYYPGKLARTELKTFLSMHYKVHFSTLSNYSLGRIPSGFQIADFRNVLPFDSSDERTLGEAFLFDLFSRIPKK